MNDLQKASIKHSLSEAKIWCKRNRYPIIWHCAWSIVILSMFDHSHAGMISLLSLAVGIVSGVWIGVNDARA